MIPKNGFYIVNTFNIKSVVLSLNDHIKRESVTLYPAILRYRHILIDGISFFYNELGNVVAFQYMDGVDDASTAKKKFVDNSYFSPLYDSLVVAAQKIQMGTKEPDTSSYCRINSDATINHNHITWSYSHIHPKRFFVFLEALFIYQLIIRVETELTELLRNKENARFIINLSKNVEELLLLELPDNYLVEVAEINLMKKIYGIWNIDKKISHVKDRFNISLLNSGLKKEYFEKRNANLINLFLAGIAIFSATQSLSYLKKSLPFLDEDKSSLALSALACLFIIYGMIRYYIRDNIIHFIYSLGKLKIRFKIMFYTRKSVRKQQRARM